MINMVWLDLIKRIYLCASDNYNYTCIIRVPTTYCRVTLMHLWRNLSSKLKGFVYLCEIFLHLLLRMKIHIFLCLAFAGFIFCFVVTHRFGSRVWSKGWLRELFVKYYIIKLLISEFELLTLREYCKIELLVIAK